MDYADNNRISHRQLYRQMVLAFLAPMLLCLPGRDQILGAAGVIRNNVSAGAFLILYIFFLRRLVPWYSDPVKMLGTDCRTTDRTFLFELCDPCEWLSFVSDRKTGAGCAGNRNSRNRDTFLQFLYAVLVPVKECRGEEGWQRYPGEFFWEGYF